MEISSFIFAILCCFLPYCAVMAIVAILGTRAKYRSAVKILDRLEQNQQKPSNKAQLGEFTKIIILIACAFLVFLFIISLALVAVFYSNADFLPKMDPKVLWIIISIFIISGVLTGVFLILLFKRIFTK